MRRAWVQFTATFVLTFVIGGGVLVGALWLRDTEQQPAASVVAESAPPLPPTPSHIDVAKTDPVDVVPMSWIPAIESLPPPRYRSPELLLQVVLSTPARKEEYRCFPLRWARFDESWPEFAEDGFSNGTCNSGGGSGGFYRYSSTITIEAICKPDGVIELVVASSWTFNESERDKADTTILVEPAKLPFGEKQVVQVSDDVLLKYWVNRP